MLKNGAIAKLFLLCTGNIREREILKNFILLEYLRGPERPTIYAAKQQHISTVEKKSKETIWKTRENK